MTTYCYVCKTCGMELSVPHILTSTEHGTGEDESDACPGHLRRDWAAENATFTRIPGGNR